MADCAATTLLIRHADIPENGGDDPHLSHAGVHRAEALAALLRDAAVGAIFATDTRRSQQTAEPLAYRQRAPLHPPRQDGGRAIARSTRVPTRSHFVRGNPSRSAQLQCRKAEQHEKHGDDPEPDHDLVLFPAFQLVVMMDRRHAKHALAGELV